MSTTSYVLPPELERRYPVVVRGEGVWLEDSEGKRYLDAMSGSSMATTLGHGRRDLVEAARRQAEQLAYAHNERLTNPQQERLAQELVELAPEGFTRVRFVAGGAEANELALKLTRAYHVERGQSQRWRACSPLPRATATPVTRASFAPPLTTTDSELEEMISRFARVVREVAHQVLEPVAA